MPNYPGRLTLAALGCAALATAAPAETRAPLIETRDWTAYLAPSQDAPEAFDLVVEGVAVLPTPGFDVSLKRASDPADEGAAQAAGADEMQADEPRADDGQADDGQVGDSMADDSRGDGQGDGQTDGVEDAALAASEVVLDLKIAPTGGMVAQVVTDFPLRFVSEDYTYLPGARVLVRHRGEILETLDVSEVATEAGSDPQGG